MCGILACFDGALTEDYLRRFHAALELLRSRGPDQLEVWSDPRTALGHTRLTIVDPAPSAGQPMIDATGRFRIILNGEIYNYQELRTELERCGAAFRTRSDTEVALEAYKCWGPDCLDRFNGMFAFAIHDQRERKLFAARDRFGVKPLYYAHRDGRLEIASEMKSLLALGASSEPHWPLVGRYLRGWGCDSGAATVFVGVRALRAGHYLEARDGRVEVSEWWNVAQRRVDVPKRYRDRVAHFRELLSDAVRLRLRNDVDTGVCLSGGMDSSAIYGFARQLRKRGEVRFATSGQAKKFRVFSISHPGSAIDEFPWVEQCVRFWKDGEQVSIARPTPERFPELIDEIIWRQEAPVWSSSVLAFHILYQHVAAQGTRVILEGHGGDELLGGYPYMVKAALNAYATRGEIGRAWRAARCLARTRNAALNEHGEPPWMELLRAFPRGRAALRWLRWQGNRFRKPDQATPSPQSSYVRPEAACAEPATEMGSLGAELHTAFTERILPIVLRVVDRATMSYGIESRAPLLDYRLVQFAFSLPDEDKIAGETKRILRDASVGVVPRRVIKRRAKLGFAIAEREWFNARPVKDFLRDTCDSAELRQSEIVDGRALARDVHRCCQQGFDWNDTTRIWEALNVFWWHKRFVTTSLKRSVRPAEELACPANA